MKLSPDSQGVSPDSYEIIISDDSTDEETVQMIADLGNNRLKWVKGPCRGPASNRNNGVRYARGEWILFIDDDCLPDAGILKNYIRSTEQNPGISVF
jgi:glycosyltransferase involved in cell wall biosynthesis